MAADRSTTGKAFLIVQRPLPPGAEPDQPTEAVGGAFHDRPAETTPGRSGEALRDQPAAPGEGGAAVRDQGTGAGVAAPGGPGAGAPTSDGGETVRDRPTEDILDGIGEAFFGLGRDWRIVYFNRACEAFFGVARERALGEVLWSLFPAMVGTEFERQYRRAMAEHVPVAFETASVVRPGHWLEVRAFPTRQGLGVGFRDVTERRRSDTEMRYQLDLMQAITDHTAEALFLMDAGGRVSFMNPAAERMFGFTAAEMTGRVLHDMIHHHHPDGRPFPIGECPLGAVFRVGTGVKLHDDIFFAKDGTPVAVSCSNTPILKDGRVAGAALVARDVTGQKRREAALKESEARFRHMADSAPALIWMTDADGRYTFANMHHDFLFGRPARDMLGDGWKSVIHPEDVAAYEAAFRAAFRERRPFSAEVRVLDHARDVRWLRCEGVPRLDDHQTFLGYTGCNIDVTDAKTHEAALRESQEQFAAMFNQASVGLAEGDLKGRLIRANSRFCAIAGRPLEELLSLRVQDVTHPDDIPRHVALFRRSVETGEPFEIEKRYIRPTGEIVWVHSSLTIVRDASGRRRTVLAAVLDITERKRLEEHRTLLINELNHRVKNTLATVQSIASQTLRNALSPHQARDDLEGRLIALSRAHDVLTRESWEGANLDEIIAGAVEPYRHRGESRFRIKGPEARLQPRTALAIAMALQELVTNAVKYGALSNEAGEVRITWSVDRSQAPARLLLRWQEMRGPPVQPPSRRGFGSRLIERSLAQDLGGAVRIDFAPTGVVCTLDAPLEGS
ncbi:MAG TPA: PAS domain S-box protein [Microvirga sp.]|jgi:PAS domain S-box-containing protein|nr:PAS domain S-box protein [Microvirga sp.]